MTDTSSLVTSVLKKEDFNFRIRFHGRKRQKKIPPKVEEETSRACRSVGAPLRFVSACRVIAYLPSKAEKHVSH